MVWMILAESAVLAVIISVFLTNWPWQWRDKRKLTAYLSEDNCRLAELTTTFWAKWQRVGKLAWITVRERNVVYIDKQGRRHQATAKFYMPWWLNKGFYDSGLIDNWDLIDLEQETRQEPQRPPAP